jgi:hypothetical protein
MAPKVVSVPSPRSWKDFTFLYSLIGGALIALAVSYSGSLATTAQVKASLDEVKAAQAEAKAEHKGFVSKELMDAKLQNLETKIDNLQRSLDENNRLRREEIKSRDR